MRWMQTIVLGAALMGAAVLPAAAQDGQDLPPRFALEFDGGTVAEYLDLVRERAPETNILLVEAASYLPLPVMQLQQVDVTLAMALLDGLIVTSDTGRAQLQVHHSFGSGTPQVERPVVYTVTAQHEGSESAKRPRRSAVISVADLIDGEISPEDLLTAVEAAVEIFGEDAPAATVRFHEATGLIIARGTGEQMNAIHNVVQELREGMKRTSATGELNTQVHRLEEVRRNLMERLEERQSETAELARQLTEWRTRSETMEQAVQRITRQLEEREHMILRLRQEMLETQNVNSQLRRELGRFQVGDQRDNQNAGSAGGSASDD